MACFAALTALSFFASAASEKACFPGADCANEDTGNINLLQTGYAMKQTKNTWCSAGIKNSKGTVCCAAECGACGGSGCAKRPGGKPKCCSGGIQDAAIECVSSDDVACIIPQHPPPPPGNSTHPPPAQCPPQQRSGKDSLQSPESCPCPSELCKVVNGCIEKTIQEAGNGEARAACDQVHNRTAQRHHEECCQEILAPCWSREHGVDDLTTQCYLNITKGSRSLNLVANEPTLSKLLQRSNEHLAQERVWTVKSQSESRMELEDSLQTKCG